MAAAAAQKPSFGTRARRSCGSGWKAIRDGSTTVTEMATRCCTLVMWLLDEKGADVNATAAEGGALFILLSLSTLSMSCLTVVRIPFDHMITASSLSC